MNEEPSDENHQLLSYISSTFSAIEDQIHESRLQRRRWELSSLPKGKPGTVSRPLGGALSFSTGNLDQLVPKANSARRNSEFSIPSIPEDVEIHEVLLEKYSNRLLEMVAQKLSKWGCARHSEIRLSKSSVVKTIKSEQIFLWSELTLIILQFIVVENCWLSLIHLIYPSVRAMFTLSVESTSRLL